MLRIVRFFGDVMVHRIFKYIEDYIPAFLLFFMTVIILIDVTGRYVFNKPLKGGPEIATFSFVWLVLLSISGCYRKNEHMKITSIFSRQFPLIQKLIDFLIDFSILLSSLYTLYVSKDLISSSSSRYMELIGIPYTFVYFSISVCFFLLVVHSVCKIFFHIKSFIDF